MILTKKSLKAALQLLLLVRSLVVAGVVQAMEPSMSFSSVAVASEKSDGNGTERTWNLSGGRTVGAKLVGFERSTLDVQRRNGDLYVNSKRTPNHLVSERSVYARLVEVLDMVSLPSDKHFDNGSERNRLLEQQATYLAVASGVTDLWEVKLSNGWNDYQGEFPVLVTGRSSDQASNAALSQYPGRYVSTIRKLSNRF